MSISGKIDNQIIALKKKNLGQNNIVDNLKIVALENHLCYSIILDQLTKGLKLVDIIVQIDEDFHLGRVYFKFHNYSDVLLLESHGVLVTVDIKKQSLISVIKNCDENIMNRNKHSLVPSALPFVLLVPSNDMSHAIQVDPEILKQQEEEHKDFYEQNGLL